MRLIRASMAAVAAVALAGSPVLAQTGAASADRAGAEMTDASELRGGWFVPLIAIILGIIAATGGDGDRPTSP